MVRLEYLGHHSEHIKSETFQFLNGAIRIPQHPKAGGLLSIFQFLNGAIRILKKFLKDNAHEDFNS